MFGFSLSELTVILLVLLLVGIFYLSYLISQFGKGIGHCFIEVEKYLGRIEELIKQTLVKIDK
jgi:Sec-independent protein translocase protein TatA